jgi:hypothetical protein
MNYTVKRVRCDRCAHSTRASGAWRHCNKLGRRVRPSFQCILYEPAITPLEGVYPSVSTRNRLGPYPTNV